VFKGEKTTIFWVGLLVFGYSLAQFCSAIWQIIYFAGIYPRVYPGTATQSLFEAQAVYSLIPLTISGVIFVIIGLYMMKKGIKQEQPSTQN
jgi:putative Mn2+ efflux pump MntP